MLTVAHVNEYFHFYFHALLKPLLKLLLLFLQFILPLQCSARIAKRNFKQQSSHSPALNKAILVQARREPTTTAKSSRPDSGAGIGRPENRPTTAGSVELKPRHSAAVRAARKRRSHIAATNAGRGQFNASSSLGKNMRTSGVTRRSTARANPPSLWTQSIQVCKPSRNCMTTSKVGLKLASNWPKVRRRYATGWPKVDPKSPRGRSEVGPKLSPH